MNSIKVYGNTSFLYLFYAWICYKINKPAPNFSSEIYFRSGSYIDMKSGKRMKVLHIPLQNKKHYYYSYVNFVNEKPLYKMGLLEFIKYCRLN